MSIPYYAIVTGAGSGLGKELAALLLEKEIPTVITGRDINKLNLLATTPQPVPCIPIAGNISDESFIDQLFAAGQSLQIPLGLVISCAGQGVFGSAGNYTRQDIDAVLEASLIGTILVGQKAFQTMKKTGGTIVMVMSTAALVGKANESIYCAAKWGARGFTEALRAEAKGTPVNILSVYPGGMQTAFWDHAQGSNHNTSGFMHPKEVAETILDNVLHKKTLGVTELTINRKQ